MFAQNCRFKTMRSKKNYWPWNDVTICFAPLIHKVGKVPVERMRIGYGPIIENMLKKLNLLPARCLEAVYWKLNAKGTKQQIQSFNELHEYRWTLLPAINVRILFCSSIRCLKIDTVNRVRRKWRCDWMTYAQWNRRFSVRIRAEMR